MEINGPYNAVKIEQNLKKDFDEDKKLKEACKDFEAIFIGMMLKTMRSTVPEDSLFGSSNQKEIYQSMFDQEIAKKIAHSDKSIGIGDMLYQKLNNQQPITRNQSQSRLDGDTNLAHPTSRSLKGAK